MRTLCFRSILILSSSFLAAPLGAQILTVTSTGSGGSCTDDSTTDPNCTLDYALAVGASVRFSPAVQKQTIAISAETVLSATIDASPDGVFLDAGGSSFYVIGNATLRHLGFRNATVRFAAGTVSTVDSCSFENGQNNDPDAGGGAIVNNGDSLIVLNSTFVGNAAFNGGAIYSTGNELWVGNSTFTGNLALTGLGSAILAKYGGVYSTIAAKNTPAGSPDIAPMATGAFGSYGYNLIGIVETFSPKPTDIAGDSNNSVDPRFSPAGIADNGGPTPTIALTAASPAVHKGACGGTGVIPVALVDQRGIPRDMPCDIGAFETTLIFFDRFEN